MDPFLGEIKMFGGNFAPRGWALCNGQLMSIAQNTALFSILGTQFGGDGIQTFALPDLRGRIPVGSGSGPGLSPYTIGQLGGSEQVTLTTGQMPAHSHLVNADGAAGGKNLPTGNYPGSVSPSATEKIYSAGPPSATMNPGMIASAGNNLPVPVLQPYECVTFIIALQGVFPSRN
jgi:microcystin-dependent protein